MTFLSSIVLTLVFAGIVLLFRARRRRREKAQGWDSPQFEPGRGSERFEPSLAGGEPSLDFEPGFDSRPSFVAKRPAANPDRVNQPSQSGQRGGGRTVVRGLRDYLRPVGGRPGTMSADQHEDVQVLLGKVPPEWMSRQQADLLLSARDYASAVIRSLLGVDDGPHDEPLVERRLTLAVVADPEIRDYVAEWAEYAAMNEHTGSLANPPHDGAFEIVEGLATRLLLAEGYELD